MLSLAFGEEKNDSIEQFFWCTEGIILQGMGGNGHQMEGSKLGLERCQQKVHAWK